MCTESLPTGSFHDLASITTLPVTFSVCRVSSTSTPAFGVITLRPDWSPTIPRPIRPRVTNQASVAPPALDSVPDARTVSLLPIAGDRVESATNPINEETTVQTRKDEVLI